MPARKVDKENLLKTFALLRRPEGSVLRCEPSINFPTAGRFTAVEEVASSRKSHNWGLYRFPP